jgi:hypothetical protein
LQGNFFSFPSFFSKKTHRASGQDRRERETNRRSNSSLSKDEEVCSKIDDVFSVSASDCICRNGTFVFHNPVVDLPTGNVEAARSKFGCM